MKRVKGKFTLLIVCSDFVTRLTKVSDEGKGKTRSRMYREQRWRGTSDLAYVRWLAEIFHSHADQSGGMRYITR